MRRRELLAAAAAAVARPARPSRSRRRTTTADILERLIALEDAAALAYRGAAAAARCRGSPSQEADHAKALRTDLEALGGRAPSAPTGVAPVARLDAAIALEAGSSPPTAQALLDLDELGLLPTVATILASHSQHRALLLRAAGRDPFG